ncbi:MAG: ATP synthase F1 subunit delta [Myxococcaceae bacterium]
MQNVSIARRYARALLEVAGANADQVVNQLDALNGLLSLSSELFDVVSNPAYTRADRLAVLEKLLPLVGAGPELTNTIRLLNDRNRLEELPNLARVYRDMVDTKLGRVRSKITSAVALSPEQQKKLADSLKAITQKEVVLETAVDASLIGGATAQVGSMLYDGSLRAQLAALGSTLR